MISVKAKKRKIIKMNEDMWAGYERLREYLYDVILEEQMKLGYERETIRFYSPAASVAHILYIESGDWEALAEALKLFDAYVKETLGTIKVSRCSGERICFLIPAEGAAYVHENRKESPFLAELIAWFAGNGHHAELGMTVEADASGQGTSGERMLAEVRAIFEKWSDDVRCIHIGSDEFDDVLYFGNGVPDSYRYCVKFDAGHASYHRFLKEDFDEFFVA